jgi:hypothetical protein
MKLGSMRIWAFIAASPLLSCASSGFYNMTDDWCAVHPDATAARCPERSQYRATGSSVVTVSDAPRVE